jgi:hypothetical protein
MNQPADVSLIPVSPWDGLTNGTHFDSAKILSCRGTGAIAGVVCRQPDDPGFPRSVLPMHFSCSLKKLRLSSIAQHEPIQMNKYLPLCVPAFCLAVFAFNPWAQAQTVSPKPLPDSRFGNWLYQKPNAALWTGATNNGTLVFSASEPPGDFCTLTLFAGATAEADFSQQFSAAVSADQQAKGTVQIEADSGPKSSKAAEGFDVINRSLRSVTSALHTYHMYLGGHGGDRFELAAFQTTSEQSWKQYGPQASQFLLSLKLANSLPADQVAKLLGQPTSADAPALPGFDTPAPIAAAPAPVPAPTPPPAAPDAPSIAPIPLPAPPTAAPVPDAPAAIPVAQAPTTIPDVPLEKSPIVNNDAVVDKTGKSVNGIKLSQHDMVIATPCIVAAADGVIHVAFVEQHPNTYTYAVYYRSSSDNGKTWSAAKNMSEDMTDISVGRTLLLVDARNRVYVIWRAGLKQYASAGADAGSSGCCNLLYRVLENGRWSKILFAQPPASAATQDDGALSFFAAIDAVGRAQVVWNSPPAKWHPELTSGDPNGTYHPAFPYIGDGLVFQATLDGATATPPHEVFLSPINGKREDSMGTYCDGLDTINGYVDSTGAPHFVAEITRSHDGSLGGKSTYEVVENGQVGPIISLPYLSFHASRDVPILLLDASGRKHVIAMYYGGENPNIRDYLVGSDDEPTIIRATPNGKGTVDGFQAYQGPGGRMIAIMQMNDTGERATGETYVSTSTGNGWTKPVNVTNNAGRRSFASKQTGSQSNVAIETSCYPGQAAATYDREGHLLLLMINNEYSLFGSTAFGVEIAGGSSSTPTLQFLRF